jgi:hypothetical protein
VLSAVGITLVLPLGLLGLRARFWEDPAEAVTAAEQFLDAIRGADAAALQRHLPPGTTPPMLLLAGPEFYALRLPFVRSQVGEVVVRGDHIDVRFALRFNPEAGVHLPLGPGGIQLIGGRLDAEEYRRFVEPLRQASERVDGWTGSVRLQRSDGQWRVSDVQPPARATQPASLISLRMSQRVPRSAQEFDDLTGFDAGQFAASWQANLAVDNRPAREVLQTLTQELGLVTSFDAEGVAPALARPVTLEWRGRSRLEAIEAVCRQVGLHPVFTETGVRYLPGPPAWPVTAAGPFLVEVEDLKEFPPQPTGILKLRCFGAGLPAPVLGLLRAETSALRLTQIAAADSRDLYRAGFQEEYPIGQSSTTAMILGLFQRGGDPLAPGRAVEPAPRGSYQEQRTFPLKDLLRDLDAIDQVRGRVRVVLPRRVARLRFAPLTRGAVQEDEGIRATLQHVDSVLPATPASPAPPTPPPVGVQLVLEFTFANLEGRPLRWAAYDRHEVPIGSGQSKPGPAASLRLEVPSETVAVHFKVIADSQEIAYPFELRNVPLRGRSPKQLEPLRFPGSEAPVAVDLARLIPAQPAVLPPGALTPPAIELRLRNYSQKDVERVALKVTYLDASGRTLKEAPLLHPASLRDVLPPQSIVKARSQVVIRVNDPDMPAGRVRALVRLTGVDFVDATTWSP